jgi:hypothetical protein
VIQFLPEFHYGKHRSSQSAHNLQFSHWHGAPGQTPAMTAGLV